MRALRLCVTALLGVGLGLWGLPSAAEETGGLEEALETLTRGPASEALETLGAYLEDPEFGAGDWEDVFEDFFEANSFTTGWGNSWFEAVSWGGAPGDRAIEVSVIAAAEAMAAAAEGRAPSSPLSPHESFANAVAYLHELEPYTSPGGKRLVLDLVTEAVGEHTQGIVPAPGMRRVEHPAWARLGIQLGLTLAEYGRGSSEGRGRVAQALGLHPAAGDIWTASGVLVFDNAWLSESHVRSLGSLLRGIPMELHDAVAMILPSSVGVSPEGGFLRTSGRILYFNVLPMDALTSPEQFPFGRDRPVAPRFTIEAARTMALAIQETQTQLRPSLAFRLEVVSANPGERGDRALQRVIPPAVSQRPAGGVMPSIAALYFTDTARAFEMGFELLRFGSRETMDQILLFADMMSGGGATTLVYSTASNGVVRAEETPVSRTLTPVAPGGGGVTGLRRGGPYFEIDVLNGIQILGRRWAFEYNMDGRLERYRRR